MQGRDGWGDEMVRIGLALASAAALTLVAPGAAQVQDGKAPAFDPQARTWAPLRVLAERAEEIDGDEKRPDADKVVRWQALYDAAIKVRLRPGGPVHPHAGYALIQLAVFHHEEGDDIRAMAEARRALEMLRPFREHYVLSYIQSVSTIGLLAAGAGKPSEALPPLKEGAEWYESYFAKLPKGERRTADYMGKSNIDFAYSQALTAAGQFDAAAEWQLRSYEARRDGLDAENPNTVSSMWAYGLALNRAGRGEEGEAWVRKAVDAAVAHVEPTNPVYVRTFDAMGIILSRRGKRAESVDYLRRSIDIRRDTVGSDNTNFFATLHNLGDILLQFERYPDARTMFLESWEGWKRKEGPASNDGVRSLALAGVADAGEGDSARAAERLTTSLDVARGRDPNERTIGPLALPALIVAELDMGKRESARQRAAAYLAEVRAAPNLRPFLVARAELLDAYASGGAAAASARTMLRVIRSDALLAASGELPQEQRAALDVVLRIAARDDDAPLALDAMVILAGSKIAQANRLVAERIAAGDAALTARIRERQDAARAFQAADAALLSALATGQGIPQARTARDAAAARLDTIRSGLARDFPAWSDASGAIEPDLASLQQGLARDQAIVAAIPAFDGVFTLTITRDAARVRRTPLTRSAIVELVARIRSSLPKGQFDREAAETLHDQLFPAADAAMLRGVTSLRFVPAGPLAALPIDLLLTRKGVKAGRDAPYLIKRFAISVSPGFTGRGAPRVAARNARMLGIGDPTPFPAARPAVPNASVRYFRGAGVDAAALGELPRLPAARAELDAVARDFGDNAQLLLGDDASEARLRAMDLSPFGTILFATHALVSGEMEGVAEPALVLARPRPGEAGDGVLTASEIATLNLDADWVILSACNTAAGDARSGAAYSGLAQAFRYAGARTLMVSHWPIRDDAARFVTVETIANSRKGMRRDVALQRAMLKLMASRKIPDAGDPFIWAPFILLGDAGA